MGDEGKKYWVLHKAEGPDIHSCKTFGKLIHHKKRDKVKNLKLCFLCLGQHMKVDCTAEVICKHCDGPHSTVMHRDDPKNVSVPEQTPNQTLCTKQCDDSRRLKTVLRVFIGRSMQNCLKNLRC